MTRQQTFRLSLFKTLFLTSLTTTAIADTVQIYNWEEYIADSVLEQFKQETGHEVLQVFYDDESVRDAVITSGRGKAYDLIMVNDSGIKLMQNNNLFQSLASLSAPYQEDFDPRWVSACGPLGVPFSWGTMGILYRTSVFKEPITSWDQLFTPAKEHQGHVVMLYDDVDTIGIALIATGAEPFTNNPEKLKAAHKLLQAQTASLLAVDHNYSYAAEHGDKSLMTMALGYTGEEYSLQEVSGNDDWAYIVPDEGSLLWADCFVAPAGKPISDATQAFLAFISRADIAAKNAEEMWIATPNLKALPLTSQEYRQDESLFASAETMAKSRPYQIMSNPALRLRNRIINNLKQ